MWEHYRKTFVGMQLTILLVTAGVFVLFGRSPAQAGATFLMMQICAVLGAIWAERLRHRIIQRQQQLPLQRR